MPAPLLHRLDSADFGVLLGRLLAIADDAVIVVDDAHRIVLFNEGAERVFGHRTADVLGQPLDLLIPEESRAAHQRLVRDYARVPQPARRMAERRDIQGRRADGSCFDADASIAQVELEGRTYLAAILRDVSAARQAARALAQSEARFREAAASAEAAVHAKGLFLANMSHEIRTPLNAVVGMTSLLLETPMSADQREFTRTIRSSSASLLGIINDILDFSKSEAGKLEIEQLDFDLRSVIEGSLDLMAPRAAEKDLNLAYVIEDGTPEALVGDAGRLRQILLNLLSNAVKFTHQGEVFVSVESTALDGARVELHVAVHDSGIGIAAEHLPRLFQSFSQVDASTTRKFGGTGLGLAITRRLAELMGGSVSVTSRPGEGSTFHVTVRVEARPGGAAGDFPRHDVPELAGKRLLVVDPFVTNRRILTRMALLWGMSPFTFPSALEAIDRIRHGERYDLALLDAGASGLAGLELAARLRGFDHNGALPVVMLASLRQRQQLAARGAGDVTAVLSRPLKAGELYATLRRALQVDAMSGAPAAAAVAATAGRLAAELPLRILVAEDNAINQRVILHLLGHLGYHADLAANGLEALDAVEHRSYDVILMDVQMPEMDGVQATRWIAQRRAPDGRPRIIAMTANTLPADRDAYARAGMDAYLPKPVELQGLAAALRAVVAARPPETAVQLPVGRGPDPGAAPVLDHGRLDHLQQLQDGGRATLVRDLIDLYCADAPGQLEGLRRAVHAGDSGRLRLLAHRFLSTTQNIGAERLAALCADLERLARLGQVGQAAALLPRLDSEHARVQSELAGVRQRC